MMENFKIANKMYGKYLRQDQTYVFDMLLQKLFVKA